MAYSAQALPIAWPELCRLWKVISRAGGESQIVSASHWVLLSHTGQYPSDPELYLPFAGTWPTEHHKTNQPSNNTKKRNAGDLFSGDENCLSLTSRSLPVLTISGKRLKKKNEATTRKSFGTEASRAMCEGTRRDTWCGCTSMPTSCVAACLSAGVCPSTRRTPCVPQPASQPTGLVPAPRPSADPHHPFPAKQTRLSLPLLGNRQESSSAAAERA